MTKDIPIIFSGPMVRALLDGRKTMTRRESMTSRKISEESGPGFYKSRVKITPSPWQKVKPGDRLWVRENWAPLDRLTHKDPGATALANRGFYAADGGTVAGEISRWTPSIHMPRSASRLTLIVTGVKIERLQDISETDAIAEGVQVRWLKSPDCAPWPLFYIPIDDEKEHSGGSATIAFEMLWRSLHGHDAWDLNPHIVALTFTVHKQNIDALPKAEAA